MTKKQRKRKVLPQKPINRQRLDIYTRQASKDFLAGYGFIIFFVAGWMFWTEEKTRIISLILYCVAASILYSLLFKEARKLYIIADTLYVEYLLSVDSFHAQMVDKVEEILVVAGNTRQYHRLIPALSIKIKNGKTIQIPLLGQIDIEKILLNWRDKYQTSSDNKVIVNE